MSWRDEFVVVTGASRGIGREVALKAARRGARVGLVARNVEDLELVLKEVRATGAEAAVAAADVGDGDALTESLRSLEEQLGPITSLVANAGIGAYGSFLDSDPSADERVVQTNFLGTVNAVRAVLPGMVARRRGRIVVVASISGRIAAPFEAVYSGAKFAQVGFAESLAVELHPYGIGVSTVYPGPVDTGFFERRGVPYQRPWPKKVEPSAIADAVLAAIEGRPRERYVPWWLGRTVTVRHLIPGISSWGTRLTFRKELARDAARRRDRT